MCIAWVVWFGVFVLCVEFVVLFVGLALFLCCSACWLCLVFARCECVSPCLFDVYVLCLFVCCALVLVCVISLIC